MNRALPFFLLSILFLVAGCMASDPHNASETGNPFPETVNAMADVDNALARASAADKKMLLIIGANWCHDSKALLKRLEDPATAPLVAAQYEVQLINVGWFERGFDVAERFGLAIYTHTPTLLIIEPGSGRVLNGHDQHIFRDASEMTKGEVLTYLQAKAAPDGWTKTVSPDIAQSPEYRTLMGEIASFEQQQAMRIRTAYTIISPKLEADTDDFLEYWKPLRALRYKLPNDLLALRSDAQTRVEAGETDIVLSYPDYSAFAWE